MFINRVMLSAVLVIGMLMSPETASAAPQWVRNLTVIGVCETDGYVEVNIVTNGTIQWLSLSTTSSMAARFLASATAAWLAGKPLDAKVDLSATQGCGGLSNCENVLGWNVHN
jgi:hypothetical protein